MTVTAGSPIYASDINDWRPVTAYKTALTGRNSTTTNSADPDLVLSLLAGATYNVRAELITSSAANAAGDFRAAWSWTGTATLGYYAGQGLVTAVASGSSGDVILGPTDRLDSTSPGTDFLSGCSTAGQFLVLAGWIACTTAVTLSLTWSQRTSNANDTRVLEGSRITAVRIG